MSQLADYYPTGTDYQLFVTESLEEGDDLLPNFKEQEPLDVSSFSLMEDGQTVPLYDIASRVPDHFCFSRRVVNGTLQFNFSQEFADKFRAPLQTIRGKVLWVRLTYTDWQPVRRVRDTFRIPEVYEHTFRHSTQPHAHEQVPISGRDLKLVQREVADIDTDIMADFAAERDQGSITASDAFRERKSRHLATVVKVEDGDSIICRVDATQQKVNVRLAGADTPEAPGKPKKNQSDDSSYRWPSTASSNDSSRGEAGAAPSKTQLDAWGIFTGDQVSNWLPKGTKVWLITNQGAAPKGRYDRYIFRVDVPGGLPSVGSVGSSTNLGEHLIKLGYAVPYASDSIKIEDGGEYANQSAKMDTLLKSAESKAGSDDAAGVWYSFNPALWVDHAGVSLNRTDYSTINVSN